MSQTPLEQIKERRAKVLEVARKTNPSSKGRSIVGAFARQANHRGKYQWIVGYEWSRLGASRITGTVYDCIIGNGPTFEAALAKAKKDAP